MLTQAEFEVLIEDGTKRITGDIQWSEDEDHSPTVEFRAEVESDPGYPLFVRASYNPLARAAAFALIHRGAGRIYCLCLGKGHQNPDHSQVGDKHKHRWSEIHRDRQAYVPPDITAEAGELNLAWQQFCAEALITHNGTLHAPPPEQEGLF